MPAPPLREEILPDVQEPLGGDTRNESGFTGACSKCSYLISLARDGLFLLEKKETSYRFWGLKGPFLLVFF